ncbi:MAG: hypothetical protein JNK82_45170 [Myxococcaceae bacterium]|nr:hypothetical protein [Myxococcaceae bacterium]
MPSGAAVSVKASTGAFALGASSFCHARPDQRCSTSASVPRRRPMTVVAPADAMASEPGDGAPGTVPAGVSFAPSSRAVCTPCGDDQATHAPAATRASGFAGGTSSPDHAPPAYTAASRRDCAVSGPTAGLHTAKRPPSGSSPSAWPASCSVSRFLRGSGAPSTHAPPSPRPYSSRRSS